MKIQWERCLNYDEDINIYINKTATQSGEYPMDKEQTAKALKTLSEGEALQRAAMAAEDWAAVVRLQRTLSVLYSILGQEPCVQ